MEYKVQVRQINYSAAYSFADLTVTAVRRPEQVAEGDLIGDFFGFGTIEFFEKIAKPSKHTLLHTFIHEVNYFFAEHYLGKTDGDLTVRDYQWLLEGANIPLPKWFKVDEVEGHIDELRALVLRATESITDAAFQLLFSDRTFLFEFASFMRRFVSKLRPGDHPCIIDTGVVARSSFPVWLKNAIFHRDKGRCQLCGRDLTNILVPTIERHIDHMVPLKASGTNDPTNFQLTCEPCNTSKGARVYATDHISYPYW
jgi:hypothetical protein